MTGNNWAIVVGINEYEHLPADDHLKYAVKDALAMQAFLCNQAQFPAANVLVCCDPQVAGTCRPSRSGLRDLLLNQLHPARGADNFWFFFAGHGIVHNHQDFLLPSDGNPDDLEETSLPISFVTNCLRDCEAHNVVLVLDMCRNRTRSVIADGSRDMTSTIGEQTLELARAQGMVTLFSCSRGERSYELAALEQGAFTHTLLAGLKESTTPRVLEQYLTNQVPTLNRQYGKPVQVPLVVPEPGWKYDRPLLLSAATPFDLSLLAVQARDAELEGDYDLAEALWWQVIEADQSTQSDRAGARRAIGRIGGKRRAQSEPAPAQPELEPRLEVQPQPEKEPQPESKPLPEPDFPGVLTPHVEKSEPVVVPGIASPEDALSSKSEEILTLEDDQTAPNFQSELESQSRQTTSLSESSQSTPLLGLEHEARETPITLLTPPVAHNDRLKPSIPPAPPFRLTRRHFLWLGLGGTVVGSVLLREALKPRPITFQPFTFDVVTVNVKGEQINKQPGQAQAFTEDLGNGVALVMVSIPGGSFQMGLPAIISEHLPGQTQQQPVAVAAAFMGGYAVIPAQWEISALSPGNWKLATFQSTINPAQAFNLPTLPDLPTLQATPLEKHPAEEEPQHPVNVKPFFIGKYAVTQAQWKAVAALPQVKQKLDPDPSYSKGAERPVEMVSWNEAVEFCERLSRKTGRVYRLASEAEWEYVCRAGTTTPFHFGETLTTDLANYDGKYTYASEPKKENLLHSIIKTTNVGSFPPNAFGLYDMHGNVWEWCLDHWHDNYQGAPTDGSAWVTSGNSERRVQRGGSWYNGPRNCRSASRYYNPPDSRYDDVGFRVVCSALLIP